MNRTTRVDTEETFADAVRDGLSGPQKTLPSKYLYDEVGSQLFEAICFLPEYYLTRAETEILEAHAQEIASLVSEECRLVEFGAGSAVKTRILIRALLARNESVYYCPIDISEEAMRIAQANILSEFPECRFKGVIGDWIDSLGRLRQSDESERLILFLGSSIGNMSSADAVGFLRAVKARMGPHDRLLVGTDLAKSEETLIAAYDDAAGVTSAFNMNLLVRINHELGGHFDTRTFRHEARWNESEGRIEMHLVSKIGQSVPIDSLGLVVPFEEGETIHTENSHKYTTVMFDQIVQRADLAVARSWTDREGRFALHLIGHGEA